MRSYERRKEERFMRTDWKRFLPKIICEDAPEYDTLYQKAWELAFDHVREIEGMPASPYMDEAFCDTQIWIWDTCFMSLFCKYAREIFPGTESLRNFYETLYGGKRLPFVIPGEGEPAWTGASAGVPKRIEIHIADNPPLFAWAEYENALFHGDKAYVRRLLCEDRFLQKHYEWIESLRESVKPEGVHCETRLIREADGYRWEGGRSGMDNTPRGRTSARTDRARPNHPDLLWIDAICQQALSAQTIAALFSVIGDREASEEWRKRYEDKKITVNRLYWDSDDGFYYDIFQNDRRFCKVMTAASYWAMTAQIADGERAKAMVKQAQNESTLGGAVPLLSLARNDANYERDGRYWRGSLWLPTAYAALKGFSLYGYHAEAHEAGRRILDHMLRTYRDYEPHTVWECYAPEEPAPARTADGKSRVRADFCGWSALGPISVYIEHVIGFHTVNAFTRTVEWEIPKNFRKRLGIKNLRFGDIVTDVVAENGVCEVTSNGPYTLKICGKRYEVTAGTQKFFLS
ncbi:MAG: hypothetical protein IJD59_02595 [Clostridia bacterium]|nr:hypothetical protein [Clostridia bacterium]